MHFYISSGSPFVSVFMKCWDLENMRNGVKLQYYHIFLHLILNMLLSVDFLFLSLPS